MVLAYFFVLGSHLFQQLFQNFNKVLLIVTLLKRPGLGLADPPSASLAPTLVFSSSAVDEHGKHSAPSRMCGKPEHD